MTKSIAKQGINGKTVFYAITLLSIVMFIIGLTMSTNVSESMGRFAGLSGRNFDMADYFILIPVCIWAWLIIIGLLAFRKDWKVRLISLGLLVPHILLIALGIAHSYGVMGILKMYAAIFSFGLLRL